MLDAGHQTRLNMKPPSLLKLLVCNRISVDSFIRRSMYLDVTSNIGVTVKDIVDKFTAAQEPSALTSASSKQKQILSPSGKAHPTKSTCAGKFVVNFTNNRPCEPAAVVILSRSLNYGKITSLKSNLKDIISGVE
ncbi:hypothetical protein Cfor_09620 [Coptotermes formosanus]|uniref:Uncharacterized protein n=1 Tax=Coptotermes formosanus TaxID=36987 RepID=A0A6L2PRE3_COPFO|nr:hypothetical protein Cfor_09620 [Coptotermes formosanus]